MTQPKVADVGSPERDPEEEPERSHGMIEDGDVRAVRRQMQLKAFGAIEATRSSVLNAAVANKLFMIRGTEL
jgi:hypothetical protein